MVRWNSGQVNFWWSFKSSSQGLATFMYKKKVRWWSGGQVKVRRKSGEGEREGQISTLYQSGVTYLWLFSIRGLVWPSEWDVVAEVFIGLSRDRGSVQQVMVVWDKVREWHHVEPQGRDDHADAAPKRPLLHLHCQRQEEEEEDLRDLVTGHKVGRLLSFYPKYFLKRCQHRRKVRVLHSLEKWSRYKWHFSCLMSNINLTLMMPIAP